MTQAICLNCGDLKLGAWTPCDACGLEPFDGDIAILLSDHNLFDDEIEKISKSIVRIGALDEPQETRFYLLLYFLSLKWPKLISFDFDAVEDVSLKKTLVQRYNAELAALPGQVTSELKLSPILDASRNSKRTKASRQRKSSRITLFRSATVILLDARNLISQGWSKESEATDAQGKTVSAFDESACSFSVVGAVKRAGFGDGDKGLSRFMKTLFVSERSPIFRPSGEIALDLLEEVCLERTRLDAKACNETCESASDAMDIIDEIILEAPFHRRGWRWCRKTLGFN